MLHCTHSVSFTNNNNNDDKGRHRNAAYTAISTPSACEISDGRRSGKCRSSRRRAAGMDSRTPPFAAYHAHSLHAFRTPLSDVSFRHKVVIYFRREEGPFLTGGEKKGALHFTNNN